MSKSGPTRYGFKHGPAVVSRVCSDPKQGVWIEVMGKRERVVIRVTPSGQIRVGGTERKVGKDYFNSIGEII